MTILTTEARDKVLADLGLTGVAIRWVLSPTKFILGSKRTTGRAQWDGTKKGATNFTIFLATQYPDEELLSTLCHEARHIWQVRTGALAQVWLRGQRVWGNQWNGSVYAPVKVGPVKSWGYANGPDEIDARQYEREAARRLFGLDYIRPPHSQREELRLMMLESRGKP